MMTTVILSFTSASVRAPVVAAAEALPRADKVFVAKASADNPFEMAKAKLARNMP